MPMIPLSIPGADGLALHCAVDDYLWPWQRPTPVVMMHGFRHDARLRAQCAVLEPLGSGDRSRIASEQQRAFVEQLPRGRIELFAGYGHGVNLLQPERCARASLDFRRTIELAAEAGSAGSVGAGSTKRGIGPGLD
jgi:hypothetical protein